MRANPHPTIKVKYSATIVQVSILECERTRTRREFVHYLTTTKCFNPRVRANPHPTLDDVESFGGIEVSILECERTRTRLAPLLHFSLNPYVSILECERTRTRRPRRIALVFQAECFNPRVRANPHPTGTYFCVVNNRRVSILECERTRTRPTPTTLSISSYQMFQSSSASEPAPDTDQPDRNPY